MNKIRMEIPYRPKGGPDFDGATPLTSDVRMIGHNEIVIPDRDIKIEYGDNTYVNFDDRNGKDVPQFLWHRSRNPKGWTRAALRTAIRKDHELFEEQDMIWGHYLDDMFIEELRYSPKTKTLRMFMGS